MAQEIAARCETADIFIQVNLTGESQKSGCDPSEIEAIATEAENSSLNVLGLMVMGPTSGGNVESVFIRAAELTQSLGFQRLSMGMSGDYKLALSHGATDLRLGESILGKRKLG